MYEIARFYMADWRMLRLQLFTYSIFKYLVLHHIIDRRHLKSINSIFGIAPNIYKLHMYIYRPFTAADISSKIIIVAHFIKRYSDIRQSNLPNMCSRYTHVFILHSRNVDIDTSCLSEIYLTI